VNFDSSPRANNKKQSIKTDNEGVTGTVVGQQQRSPRGNSLTRVGKNITNKNTGTQHQPGQQETKQSSMAAATAALTVVPAYKAVHRVHTWDENVEENYRFQCAGFRDLRDFEDSTENPQEKIDRWPHNGYIKKLVRKDGCFMYFDRSRECIDKEVHKVKLYKY